jgi:hypothetical protein
MTNRLLTLSKLISSIVFVKRRTYAHHEKLWNLDAVGGALAVCVCGAECCPNL